MTTANDILDVKQDVDEGGISSTTNRPELYETGANTLSRYIGIAAVIGLLISGTLTFLFLMGLTPINPDSRIIIAAAVINGLLATILIFLIGREVYRILRSRRKGRAASRLHVRIMGLFGLVAALPAILVAIVAGITLDLGLDRWFELRTKKIVESSVSVARAYLNESSRVLMGNTLSMASNLDRNRQLYVLDRRGFIDLFTIEARGRGLIHASLLRESGAEILEARLENIPDLPSVPKGSLKKAINGDPIPIPPGSTNLVGAIFKLREIPNAYLYTIIRIQPEVIDALRQTQLNSAEYNGLEQNRLPFQFTFAILYIGVCLIVLLSAIWMGISLANRIVSPIRRLIFVADEVSGGNLDARVDLHRAEGDLRFLGETFNVMLSEIKDQQAEILTSNELMDQRARFIEAVLSGVSSGVIGLDEKGYISIANRSALPMLGMTTENLSGDQLLQKRVPELGEVFSRAVASDKAQFHEQISFTQNGRERTLNVQVTAEQEETASHSYVMTIDDITDLVSAQRNTAWADVARRIAHEIKNPLTPIQLSAERIRRRYGKMITEDREVFDNCTDTIIRQVGDIGKMVDEFSAFARMPTPEMADGVLDKIIKETVFMQKVGFPDIEFELKLGDEPIQAVFDSRMLSQAMINVIKNAAESIESVSDADPDFRGKITVIATQDANNIDIDFIDNGKGLPETNRQRLLEPYMTTREKGTGLGLAIVRKILEDHGGGIDLMDAPDVESGGRGAMMRLRLPAKPNSINAEDSAQENKPDSESE